jgi:hypothetical protein
MLSIYVHTHMHICKHTQNLFLCGAYILVEGIIEKNLSCQMISVRKSNATGKGNDGDWRIPILYKIIR